MYLIAGFGVTVGFHRLLTHRAFQTHKPIEYGFAIAGLDVRAGPGHRLGRRPPQAPRARRRGGRPALAARAVRRGLDGRAQGPVPRAHGLAVHRARPGRAPQVRQGPHRGPRDAPDQPPLPLVGPARPRDGLAHRLRPRRLHAEGGAHRPAVGRLRAHLPAAPRDLVDQLRLPLLRPPPLRGRGRVDERVLARAPVARRGVAPQPPRVPALGAPRPEAGTRSTSRPR